MIRFLPCITPLSVSTVLCRRTSFVTKRKNVMKKVYVYIALAMLLSSSSELCGQTLTKGIVLIGDDGNQLTLSAPTALTTGRVRFPGNSAALGAMLYVSDVNGSTRSLTWLNPGSNGDVLTLVGGVPTWSAPTATNSWNITGNGHSVTDNTNNLLGTTTANPLRIITGSGGPNTRILISATGAVTVNGTAGTPNVSMTSIGAATGTTGRVMFATDATGALNALATPASNGQILTSTTGGVLSWTNSPTLNFWSLTGNSGQTDNTNNLLGTTDAIALRLITGGASNTRVLISATGDVLVNGTAGTPNVRTTSLTSASAASTGGVMFADASGYLNRLSTPASNGQILTSTTGGVLSWTSSPTLNFWSLTGNSGQTDNTNNLLGTTDAIALRLITGGTTRVTIGATGGMTVAGTSGTSNVTLSSLATATGTTGRVMFATDATGAVNALAFPASSGQVLTSTTGGVLSWTSSPTLNYWDLAGNSTTTAWNGTSGSFLGTTSAQPLSIATTNATAQDIRFYTGAAGANERMRLNSTGELGIGTTATSGRLLHVNGTAGTANVRMTSLSSTNLSTALAATDGLVIADNNGDLTKRSTSVLATDYVQYNVAAAQATSSPRSKYLFNVAYNTADATAGAAVGAVIAAAATGLTNTAATGLTITATATGTGTATGLAVTAVSGTGTRNAIDATGDVRLLSTGGTASKVSFQNPAATFATTFTAGAQTGNVNYVLPLADATTASYALLSDGAGNLSWGEPTSVNSFASSRDNFEDFIFDAYSGSGSNDNQYSFTQVSSGSNAYSDVDGDYANRGSFVNAGTSDFMGMHQCGTGTTATGMGALGGFNHVNKMKLGGKPVVFETRIRIETLSTAAQTFIYWIGLTDSTFGTSATDPNNGVFIKYTDNGSGTGNNGKWEGVTRSAASPTAVASSSSVVANQWYKMRVSINAAGTQVDFYVDETLIGSSTTTIPTAYLHPVLKLRKTNGTTNRTASADWFILRMVR